ncbi:Aldolase-type TIM barrel [Penicillium alfredii]|uniref:Aldolase-type TIM barrel n=1 Tax=Penicillium alfredii TaxID=1506179 RepID=A0A9W9GBE0_9EURO|nr:Aldolase-type TIM barrel [Penicillium alfredii]KAJ5115437.1 Aldolase-type TIM barrel [Penicillium alfredii]
MLYSEENKLIFRFDDHLLWIQPWGENAFRVRATKLASMPLDDRVLSIKPATLTPITKIPLGQEAVITNGKITAAVSQRGKITIYNSKGTKLLEEYARNRQDLLDPKCSALEIEARALWPILGGDCNLNMRFESLGPQEKVFGMGQYQQPHLNLKGTDLELAHRNSQASVPFALSSRGYGFLWNNPAIGRAALGTKVMSFEAYWTRALDYWVVASDTPAEIEEAYAWVTGYVPMMPEYGLGSGSANSAIGSRSSCWRLFANTGGEMGSGSLIQNSGRIPEHAMVKELDELKVKLMVSIWPTVENASENYPEMLERGLLIRHDRGVRVAMQCDGNITRFDATNPAAREYVWHKAKKNHYDKEIQVSWLDEAEPE